MFYKSAIANYSPTSLLMLGDPGKQGTRIYVVTVEIYRCRQARHTHLRSYRGNLKNMSVYITFL